MLLGKTGTLGSISGMRKGDSCEKDNEAQLRRHAEIIFRDKMDLKIKTEIEKG
jgi:hypothetical protein